MTNLAIHAGMPDEVTRLKKVFPSTPIFYGTDKLKLDELVDPGCKLIANLGVCGGLSPPWRVADLLTASSIVNKAGNVVNIGTDILGKIIAAGTAQNLTIHPVPWYSSGLLDEADTTEQRAAIYKKYGAQAIDDESRFTEAFAQKRNIPFVIVRPPSDDWTETLPLEARGAIMNSDGSANVEYLLKTLRLVDVPMLTRIAQDYKKSLDALETVARAIAPTLIELAA